MNENEAIEPWEDAVDMAMNYQYGIGDYIQDYNDAIKYYLKAIKLGYTQGYVDVAQIYALEFDDNKKAFEYYKAGAEKGCSECYSDMGLYYLYTEKNLDKALKSYELYIKYTPEEKFLNLHICNYLILSLKAIVIDKTKEDIEYFEKTLQYKDEILKYFNEDHYIPLIQEYKSFYDLPKSVQEDVIAEHKKYNIDGYITASFYSTLNLGNDFLDYLELIYSNNYISPNDSDGHLFENTFQMI